MTTPDPDPAEALMALGPFIRPLTAEEREERERLCSGEAGYLTRETIILAMLEIDAGWLSAWKGYRRPRGAGMIIFPLIRSLLNAILRDPETQYAMNKWLMYFWVLNFVAVHVVFFLASPLWQKVAILYLADISVYACIGQHYTGMAASLTGLKADERAESE